MPRLLNMLRLARNSAAAKSDLAMLLPQQLSVRRSSRPLVGRGGGLGTTATAGAGLLTDKLRPEAEDSGRIRRVSDGRLLHRPGRHARGKVRRPADELCVTDAHESQAQAILAEAKMDPQRPMVMLNPGGSFGPSKLWPAERFAAVADELAERRGRRSSSTSPRPSGKSVERPAAAMRRPPAINLATRENSIGLLKSLSAAAGCS